MFELTAEEPKPFTQTLRPTFVGGSVLALKYDKGVVLATNTLVTAGYSKKQVSRERVIKINDECIIACSGDHADLQHISELLRNKHITDELNSFDSTKSAEELHNYLQRKLYERRNKMNPIWVNVVVIGTRGWQFNQPRSEKFFLGICDMYGTKLTEEDLWANGLGHYFSIPHLRIIENAKDLTLEQAKDQLRKCLKITSKLDCRTSEEYQFAYVDEHGAHIEMPEIIEPRMEFASY